MNARNRPIVRDYHFQEFLPNLAHLPKFGSQFRKFRPKTIPGDQIELARRSLLKVQARPPIPSTHSLFALHVLFMCAAT